MPLYSQTTFNDSTFGILETLTTYTQSSNEASIYRHKKMKIGINVQVGI
jgi:hypothetical protein